MVWGFFINALSVEANSGRFEFIPCSLTHCNLDLLSTKLLPCLEVDSFNRKASKKLPYIFGEGWVCLNVGCFVLFCFSVFTE